MRKFKEYDKYKNTDIAWLNKIPSHWTEFPNRYFFTELKNKVGKNSSKYTLLSLTKNGVIIRDLSEMKGKFPAEFDSYKIVNEGNLILCLFDIEETPRTVGLSKNKGMITGAYNVLKIDNVNPKFITYFYIALDNTKELRSLYRGLRKTIKIGKFLSVKTPYPPMDEQDKIVNFIEHKEKQINKLIKKQKKLIELLEEKKKIIITEAVTKGLDKSVPMKDSGIDYIGYVPKHWEVGKIKKYYKMITGFTPDTTQIGYYDDINGYKWMTISDLCGKYTPDSTNRKISEKFIKLKHPKQTPKGSLLYSFKLSVGQVAFAKENIYTNEAIASFLESDKCNLKFLFYSSLLIVNNANENIYSAKILNQNLIKNAFIVFPPLQEQKVISDYLDKRCELIEKIIDNKNSLIRKLEEYKKTLISFAVTGQIDVRDYEIPETDDNIDLEEIENISEDDTVIISEVEYANN